jgi:hypothetical protein
VLTRDNRLLCWRALTESQDQPRPQDGVQLMKSESKRIAGPLFGFARVGYAWDKAILRLSDFSRNQIHDQASQIIGASFERDFTENGLPQPLRESWSATTAKRQNNQKLPHSRLGELTRCCAPVFHSPGVTQLSPVRHKIVTRLSYFRPRAVTILREAAVAFRKLEIQPAGAGSVT